MLVTPPHQASLNSRYGLGVARARLRTIAQGVQAILRQVQAGIAAADMRCRKMHGGLSVAQF
jgi:hypothetical protein